METFTFGHDDITYSMHELCDITTKKNWRFLRIILFHSRPYYKGLRVLAGKLNKTGNLASYKHANMLEIERNLY